MATLAVAFSGYLGQVIPLGSTPPAVVSVLTIAVVAVVNILGTRKSAGVQNWTTAAKMGGLLLLSAVLIARGHPAPGAGPPVAPPSSLAAGLGAAMIGVLWAYEGWQYVTFSAGEARDPQRTFPPAITVASVVLIALYVLANVGYLSALGPAGAARSDHVAADAVSTILGPAAGRVVGALILVSIFSALNGLTLTAPRLYYAMARDGVFFKRLAIVHPRLGTPAFAIAGVSLWAALLAATGTFEQLLTYVVFVGWIFYALGALSIFAFRRRQPDATRPFRVPGYPVTPVLFVLAAGLLVLNTVVTQPDRAAVGVGVVVLGAPVYLAWRRGSKSAA
jgi:APA family basic amino acid/polyamine antiporter